MTIPFKSLIINVMSSDDFRRPGELGRERAKQIRELALAELSTDEFRDIGPMLAARFGVSRQVVHKQLKRLEMHGLIEGRGRTKGREHRLKISTVVTRRQVEGLQEHELWKEFAEPALRDLPDNVLDICHFGFTEMVNNVIDHSESERITVEINRAARLVDLVVVDRGVGIFKKIKRALKLPSEQEAIFELTKGKLTTDPTRHTGEGIFYTSRAFDKFDLLSGDMFLTHKREGDDWLIGSDGDEFGTLVRMRIDPSSKQTMEELYQHYSVARDDFAFNKTNVVLKLLDTGDSSFVSRSQAKRVLARLPRFKEVILDFEGVASVGPAFADEIFRVFASEHPDVHFVSVNTTAEVQRMIDRAIEARAEVVTHNDA